MSTASRRSTGSPRDAENELDLIVATIKARGQEFVMKPFDTHILIGKLDRAVRPTGDRT